jgi:hypothetical protein
VTTGWCQSADVPWSYESCPDIATYIRVLHHSEPYERPRCRFQPEKTNCISVSVMLKSLLEICRKRTHNGGLFFREHVSYPKVKEIRLNFEFTIYTERCVVSLFLVYG